VTQVNDSVSLPVVASTPMPATSRARTHVTRRDARSSAAMLSWSIRNRAMLVNCSAVRSVGSMVR